MKSRRTPIRWMLGITALTLLLACGPADESVQGDLGNLPLSSQEEEPTATPEPTPYPTFCIDVDGLGRQCGIDMWDPSTVRFPKLIGILEEDITAAEEAEERRNRDSSSTTSEVSRDFTCVVISLNHEVENARDLALAWLEERNITADLEPYPGAMLANACIPLIWVGPLSELDAILKIQKQSVPEPS